MENMLKEKDIGKEKVIIRYGEREYFFEPEDDGTLGLSNVNVYFPNANGIIYMSDGKQHGLLIKDGKIHLNPLVKVYEVHIASSQAATDGISITTPAVSNFNLVSPSVSTSVQQLYDARASSVSYFRNKIFNTNTLDEDKKESTPRLQISQFKVPKMNDLRKASSNSTKKNGDNCTLDGGTDLNQINVMYRDKSRLVEA